MLNDRKTVLVVDDDNIILMLVHGLLKTEYECVPVRSATDALHYLEQNGADLVLLAIEMPEMNGLDVARAIHAMPQHAQLPILLLTTQTEQQQRALEDPFVLDVVRKPFLPAAFLRQIGLYLELTDLRRRNSLLVAERTAAVVAQRNRLVSLFAAQVEYRDQSKGTHIKRTQAVVRKLITGYNKLFPEKALSVEEADLIVLASELHDLGKISIADAILLKPGRLTPEEYDIMKKHTVYGAQTLECPTPEDPDKLLQTAQQIALSHHEKWDGTGYPYALRAEQIPLAARIVAVADVLDALLSLRPYRRPHPFEVAVQQVVEARGKHFDPDLVDAFLDQQVPIHDIYQGLSEENN